MSNDERREWELGWSGHERLQLERLSRLPLADKLQWLEEAHHVVLHLSRTTLTPGTPADTDCRLTKTVSGDMPDAGSDDDFARPRARGRKVPL